MSWLFDWVLRQHSRPTAMALVFISSSAWGLLWLPLHYVTSLGLTGLWAALCFFIAPLPFILALTYRSLWAERRHWADYSVVGVTMGAGFLLYSCGLIFGSVTKTTVLFYLLPVWASVLSVLFLRESIVLSRVLCIALGLFGCTLLIRLDWQLLSFEITDLYGLGAGVCWAIGAVFVRARGDNLNVLHSITVIYLFAMVCGLLIAYLLDSPLPQVDLLWRALAPALFFSLLFIYPSFLFMMRVQQYLSPSLVGVLMMSEVLMAIFSARLLLGESILPLQWLGVLLALTAGVGIGLSEDKSTRTQ